MIIVKTQDIASLFVYDGVLNNNVYLCSTVVSFYSMKIRVLFIVVVGLMLLSYQNSLCQTTTAVQSHQTQGKMVTYYCAGFHNGMVGEWVKIHFAKDKVYSIEHWNSVENNHQKLVIVKQTYTKGEAMPLVGELTFPDDANPVKFEFGKGKLILTHIEDYVQKFEKERKKRPSYE